MYSKSVLSNPFCFVMVTCIETPRHISVLPKNQLVRTKTKIVLRPFCKKKIRQLSHRQGCPGLPELPSELLKDGAIDSAHTNIKSISLTVSHQAPLVQCATTMGKALYGHLRLESPPSASS